jgi:acetyltransferase
VYGILEAYGLPVAPWRMAETPDEALAAAQAMGYPVVVKVDCEAIDHKSDMGGVAVNLKDAGAVRAALAGMQARLGHLGKLGFLVQQFMAGGQEMIVGATSAPGLGHLVMFGLGGIYVEVLKDVVFKLAPLTRAEAQEMLSSIKAACLLDGVRGQAAVDKEGLVDILLRLSMLLGDLPMILEMDMNPILAFETSVFAVDGRIRI